MSISVADLVSQVRLDSGLRNNQLWSDSQICGALTDGYHDLRDRLIIKFWQWFRKTFDFTLAGGNDGDRLNLVDNVPDLEMIKGLDFVDSSGNHFTVDMLDSFANRNVYNTVWPFGGSWGYNGQLGRRYYPDGDFLILTPPSNSQGNYQLIYTPQAETLALPVTKDFTLDTGDIPAVPPTGGLSGTGSWALLNADADATVPTDGGFDLTLTFTTTNLGFSGTYHVVSVGLPSPFGSFGRSTFGVSNLASTSGFTSPPTGSGTYTYQPVGTIGSLPVQLTPWKKYITLFASRVIRASRRQPADDLDMQFNQISARVSAVTKQRSEGIKQAPITRGMFGGGWGRGGVG